MLDQLYKTVAFQQWANNTKHWSLQLMDQIYKTVAYNCLTSWQNEIYGSFVAIQYHIKCANPLYPKFPSNKISIYMFCYNLYLVIPYVLIPITDKCSHPFISHCLKLCDTFCNKKKHRYGIPEPIWQRIDSLTLTSISFSKKLAVV